MKMARVSIYQEYGKLERIGIIKLHYIKISTLIIYFTALLLRYDIFRDDYCCVNRAVLSKIGCHQI